MRVFYRVLGFVLLAAALVSAYNFFALADQIEPRAQEAACAGRGPKCTAAMTRMFRTPLWQDVRFRVARETVEVRCARSAYLFGEYACAVIPGSGPPGRAPASK
jgi:hypothetical protein